MTNSLKNALIFLIGAGAGAFCAAAIVKDKYECIMEEVLYAKNIHNDARDAMVCSEEKPDTDASTQEYKDTYIKNARRYGKCDFDSENEIAVTMDDDDNYNEMERLSHEANHYESDSGPYVISIEEFSDEMPHFDKSTIYYYAGDDTLVDENEEIISDIVATIGEEAIDRFRQLVSTPETFYVRNHRMAIDYEIICLDRSFSETDIKGS